jgi:acyl-homoserine lactone acylase PvdQ
MTPKSVVVPALAALILGSLASTSLSAQAVSTSAPASDPGLRSGAARDSLRVTIHRDTWGVPHIYGSTDAGVVFGGAYAQAEDSWPQVEENFVRAIGRGAELDGESALLDDYLVHGLEIPRRSIEEYERAPDELRRLYDAFAAGFNHYLETHPDAERRVLERVEPWYTLALIRFKYHHNEYLGYAGLQRSHSLRALAQSRVAPDGERALGSKQWAVAGSRTRSGHPMLLINPHVSFFGMSTYTETHLASAEGLEFSGLTRFGFMLPYMGNNAHLGWAYTDNYGDHGDLYLIDLDANGRTYRYGDGRRTVTTWTETINVRTDTGLETREYRFAKTHQGPILGYTADDRPLAVRLAKLDEGGWFAQWYEMMRAGSLEEWRAAVALLNVPYMNTMYADRDGNILYIYNHAIPRRSTDYDWSEPVDGADPGTEWDGYHALDELPQFLNPETGYLQNTNSSPFTATEGIEVGPDDFPPYMVGNETDNRRAQSSRRVLRELTDLTLDDFANAALTTRLVAADEWLPDLFAAFAALERADPDRASSLAGPIAALRDWNREADTASVATTLFVAWAGVANPDRGPIGPAATPAADPWLDALARFVERLEVDWGTWEVPWGEINRIQRPDAAGALPFSDTLPSLPVAGAPGWLGSIFVFNTEPADDGMRRYGRHGNSFVKLVEFTPDVRARSVFVFGQSGDPASPHYFDQAALYSEKRFKPAWFSAANVQANAVRTITLKVPAPVGAPGAAGTSGSPTDSCGPDDTIVSFSTEDAGVVYATLSGLGELGPRPARVRDGPGGAAAGGDHPVSGGAARPFRAWRHSLSGRPSNPC